MKSISVPVIPMLVLVLCTSTVFAKNWRIGGNGRVFWDQNCDFYGHDIGSKPSRSEQCGGVCIANNACTHFTHFNGVCYMKRKIEDDGENDSIERKEIDHRYKLVCGFVIGRSDQPTN